MPELVYLAHGFVEDSGDDPAVGVAGRAGIAFAKPKAADEEVALLVIGEAQMHAFGIILPTGKAEVFLQADVLGTMTVPGRFLRHAAVIVS